MQADHGTHACLSLAVQHECIPHAILGMDVLCQAKSGMGKTAVFVLSILQQLEPKAGEVSALVLCHTRELAYQVHMARKQPDQGGPRSTSTMVSIAAPGSVTPVPPLIARRRSATSSSASVRGSVVSRWPTSLEACPLLSRRSC